MVVEKYYSTSSAASTTLITTVDSDDGNPDDVMTISSHSFSYYGLSATTKRMVPSVKHTIKRINVNEVFPLSFR
jgi:surface polysaccharide O-acyltransferase-like enzyme